MLLARYLLIVVGLVVWFYPFISAHRQTPPALTVNRRSRWGILLQFIAFTLVLQGHFWARRVTWWQMALCAGLFMLACGFSWTSSRALAGQLRVDAALGSEHRLVRSGPYGLVRNPIYFSMLLVMCAMAVVVAPWWLFLISLPIFLAGVEIRVRTEEKLLAERFGEEFTAYKKSVPGYIPFV